jgi:hypothetical protein
MKQKLATPKRSRVPQVRIFGPVKARTSTPSHPSRSVQNQPFSQLPQRRIYPVDLGGVLQVRKPIHFLLRCSNLARNSTGRNFCWNISFKSELSKYNLPQNMGAPQETVKSEEARIS